MKKPWLDDPVFKEAIKEKQKLYAKKKKKGSLTQEEEDKLSEISKEVGRIRSSLKREYFTPTIAGECVSTFEIDATPGGGEGAEKAEEDGCGLEEEGVRAEGVGCRALEDGHQAEKDGSLADEVGGQGDSA